MKHKWEARKVFCEVVQGVVYDDRCLFKLSKVIENNKSCENCILQELEKIKSYGRKKTRIDAGKRNKPRRKGRDQAEKDNPHTRLPKIPEGEAGAIKGAPQISKQSYSMRALIGLLGKSERTIREWAEKGKIPAQKVGKKWRFFKEEMDRWLSERKGEPNGTQEIEDEQNILEDED